MIKTKYVVIFIYMVLQKYQNNFASSETISLVCDEFERIRDLELDILIHSAFTPEYETFYCTVKNFHVNYTSLINCNVYPAHRDNVKVVRFVESTLLYIPYCMFRYFGNIQEFEISYANIEAIHRNFEGAVSLMFLTMSHNNITEIPASVFVDTPQLAMIDLSYNQIEKINKFAFANARSLSRIVLSHNKIKTMDANLFNDVSFLDQIELDFNLLETLPNNLFKNNGVLQKIYLNHNKISNLSCEVFQFGHYLDYLQLEANHLEEFSSVCIPKNMDLINLNNNNLKKLSLNDVKNIYASNNSLTDIRFGNYTEWMRKLVLSNNSLTDISSILKTVRNLNHLDLSYNYVGKLNISSFAKLNRLEKLYLSHTHLANINFGTFANQKQLRILDISYNNLSTINLDMFSTSLKNVEEFYVDGNNLTELSGQLTVIFPALHILGISNNNFNCTYLSQLLRVINFGQVQLNIDPEAQAVNTTHISGIPCDHVSNAVSFIDHDGGTDGNENEFEQNLQSMFNLFLKTNGYQHRLSRRNHSQEAHLTEELKQLRSKYASDEDYKRTLETHLGTMKFLLCFICLVCLAFVIVKFARIFADYRRLSFNPDIGVYQSTATMNTLQSNVVF